MTKILTLDPDAPDQSLLNEAAAILRHGGIIAYPTETFYGLGADSENEKAIEKLFTVKGRTYDKPISIIIGRKDDVAKFTQAIPEKGKILMDTFWPGGLTIIFTASQNVSPRLTAGTGKIGIRLSSNKIASRLAQTLAGAVTATSANLSGNKESTDIEEVMNTLADSVDIIVNGGRTPGGKGSTVVDATVDPPVILREGVIPSAAIFDTLERT